MSLKTTVCLGIAVSSLLAFSLVGCASSTDGDGAVSSPAIAVDELDAKYTSPYAGLSFRYPSTWKFERHEFAAKVSGRPSNGITLTSPSGKVVVHYDDGVVILTGGDHDAVSIDTVDVERFDMAGYQAPDYVENVVGGLENGHYDPPHQIAAGEFSVGFGLMSRERIHAGVQDLYPHVVGSKNGWLEKVCVFGDDFNTTPILQFGAEQLGYGPQRFKTREEAAAFFKTPEYVTAKKIILSLEGLKSAPIATTTKTNPAAPTR